MTEPRNIAKLRSDAAYALSDEGEEHWVDAPEDAPRWIRSLARDVLALVEAVVAAQQLYEVAAAGGDGEVLAWLGLEDALDRFSFGEQP